MPRGHVFPDGHAVAVLRGEAGLTQDELAMRAGYGLRTIGKIESSQPTTSPTLAAVATVLSDSLGRSVRLCDLLSHADEATHAASVVDHVQWLELAATSAVLTEMLAFRHRSPCVRSRIESIESFHRREHQSFHTGVTQPTDCLTLLVHFAADRPFKSIDGFSQRSAISQPIELLPGQLAFWRIASPEPGETFELRWA
ncbi:MAG TPA: helix-turn-helix transcriptional regulator [Pirellulales bacterium]|nr:helix-turn-helix transcriptional regulator [Pirellulales bacterium]